MTEMRLKPPPKPDRGTFGKKRITERVKESAYEYYEVEIAKGKLREQILERLGKKYERSTREIERWIRDVRENKKLEQNIREARRQHWSDLAKMAERAAGLLLGPSYRSPFGFLHRGREYKPIQGKQHKAIQSKSDLPSIGTWLAQTFEIQLIPASDLHSQYEYDLWRCLKVHLSKEFKGLDVERKLKDWETYSTWLCQWQIAGDEYESQLPHRPPEIEDRQSALTKELRQILNLVAERRTFKGSCDICKDL